jgi:hypothetical protein
MVAGNLREVFERQQHAMRAKLEYELTLHRHPVARGDASEQAWISTLRAFFPRRYEIAQAFVVDYRGDQSQQQDVVIFDRHYSPLLSDAVGGIYVPAEAVYAVFEVKQSIGREEVLYASGKVQSVRRLERTSAEFRHLGGKAPADRPCPPIFGGLLAVAAGWSPPYGGPFRELLEEAKPEERLDLGCSLAGGAFEAVYAENAPVSITTSRPEIGLSVFMFRLLHRLQQESGTVGAIKFDSYTATLGQ